LHSLLLLVTSASHEVKRRFPRFLEQQAEEKLLKKLLDKLNEKKPTDEQAAKADLKKILGNVSDDVAKKLMEWKKADH
jgi:hypothetical protein